MDFKDIFEYREKTKDIYKAWSVEVNKAAAKISDAEFVNPAEAIRKIVATELMPKLTEYEAEMAAIRDKLFVDLVKGLATWEMPAISGAYFTELGNLGAISLFATGLKAAVVALGAAKGAVPPIADYIGAKAAAKRKHAVSYLVGLSKR